MTTLLALDALLVALAVVSRIAAVRSQRRAAKAPRPVVAPSAASPLPASWVAPGWMLAKGPRAALRIARRRTYQIRRVA